MMNLRHYLKRASIWISSTALPAESERNRELIIKHAKNDGRIASTYASEIVSEIECRKKDQALQALGSAMKMSPEKTASALSDHYTGNLPELKEYVDGSLKDGEIKRWTHVAIEMAILKDYYDGIDVWAEHISSQHPTKVISISVDHDLDREIEDEGRRAASAAINGTRAKEMYKTIRAGEGDTDEFVTESLELLMSRHKDTRLVAAINLAKIAEDNPAAVGQKISEMYDGEIRYIEE